MPTEARVKDYPHLRKVNGAIINKDERSYESAVARAKSSARMRNLEGEVSSLSHKVGMLMDMLEDYRERIK